MKNVPGNGISKKKLPLHTVGFSLFLSERHHRVPYTAASGYIIRVDKRNERIKRKKNTKENKEEKKRKKKRRRRNRISRIFRALHTRSCGIIMYNRDSRKSTRDSLPSFSFVLFFFFFFFLHETGHDGLTAFT